MSDYDEKLARVADAAARWMELEAIINEPDEGDKP